MSALPVPVLEHGDGDGGEPVDPPGLLPVLQDVLGRVAARGPFFKAAVAAAWREVGAEYIPEELLADQQELLDDQEET